MEVKLIQLSHSQKDKREISNTDYHVLVLIDDFKQAYDGIKRIQIYNASEKLGISVKLKRMVQIKLRKTGNRIKINDARYEKFQVR